MRVVLREGERTVVVELAARGAGVDVSIDGVIHTVVRSGVRDGTLWFVVGDRTLEAVVARDADRRFVHVDGSRDLEVAAGEPPRSAARRGGRHGPDQLAATMHSQVVSVAVQAGAIVARGDTLIVLEAMKMESRITAPHAGRVSAVHCAPGDVVERGRVLVEVEAAG